MAEPTAGAAAGAEPIWSVPLAHTGGLLLGMRLGIWALWPEAFSPARSDLRTFELAYTRPPELRADRGLLESDGDPWALNTIGHGLFGAEVYGRARRCGHHPLAGLLLAGAASTTWEYLPEAFHKRPSAIDLLWTPVVGGLLGEGRFQLQRWLEASGDPSGWRRAALVAIDPLGELERAAFKTRC
jgi:hypothetical protein